MKVLLDLDFLFMDFSLWSCLEFCCHVYLDDAYASDKVTNAGNGLMPEIKFKRSRFSRALDQWISFSTKSVLHDHVKSKHEVQ